MASDFFFPLPPVSLFSPFAYMRNAHLLLRRIDTVAEEMWTRERGRDKALAKWPHITTGERDRGRGRSAQETFGKTYNRLSASVLFNRKGFAKTFVSVFYSARTCVYKYYLLLFGLECVRRTILQYIMLDIINHDTICFARPTVLKKKEKKNITFPAKQTMKNSSGRWNVIKKKSNT